ncbi:MAG TPA: polysaccharide deacetylase family protein [Microvirga sp.]
MPVTFTFDLEDHRASLKQERRFANVTWDVLRFLEQHRIRGTFFTVGQVAEEEPELIKAIASAGHELGVHSYRHIPLTKEDPKQFRIDVTRARKFMEDLCGVCVQGYRAPIYSLTAETIWAVDALLEAGFAYSSSVMPVPNPLFGFPEAPKHPFWWSQGLFEIPCPVGTVGPANLPFLGGFYLRYMPTILMRRLLAQTDHPCPWTYCHPYDFDADEKFGLIAGASLPVSVLLWLNRRRTYKKIEAVMTEAAPPFAQVLGDLQRNAQVFCYSQPQ